MTGSPTKLQRAFGAALRQVRRARGLTQEEFSESSSRTYVSTLERGMKNPTLEKLEQLSGTLGVHPMTLLTLTYTQEGRPDQVENLQARIARELKELRASKKG